MGLHLTGKGSILDAIGGAANTVGNAVVSGVRDVGDLGSLAAANITGNQQAGQNARAAITANDSNLTHGSLIHNAAGLGGDLVNGVVNPIVRPVVGLGLGLGEDAHNALFGAPAGGYGPDDANNPLARALLRYGTEDGKVDPSSGRQLAGNAVETGVNLVTGGKGKAAEQGVEALARHLLGNSLPGRVTSRVAASGVTGATAGATYGAGQAVKDAHNLGEAATDVGKGAEAGAIAGTTLGTASTVPDVVRTVKANHLPLNEVGGINNPSAKPPAESSDAITNPEDSIHANNPLAPQDTVAPSLPEPSASDIAQATKAAENANAPEIDFTKVDGANKAVADAVAGRANTMRQIDASAKGGLLALGEDGAQIRTSEHTPFYRQVYAETGRKPTIAAYKAEAERQLRSGSDEESKNYQDMVRHASVEDELKSYEQANRQSGYNKVKVRNIPGGPPKGIPSWVREKISSPEYVAKRASGELLQRVRDELPIARAHVQALDKQVKSLGRAGDVRGITELNKENAAARLRLRVLEGMERTQSGEYGRRAQALDDKYPDVALRQKGSRGKVTVSGTPMKGGGARLAASPSPVNLDNYEGYQPSTPYEPYTGPNLNEDAFTPEDIKRLEAVNGHYSDEEVGASYSPDHDMSLPPEDAQPPARNLDGDTAAFNVLHEGGTIDDAVKAYQDATGSSAEEAKAAVNTVAETGVDMGSNEDVLRRNPLYGQVSDFAVNDVKDVTAKAKSFRNVSDMLVGRMNQLAQDMSDHDVQLLDKLRGHSIAEVASEAEDPVQFTEVAQAAKDVADYNHEIRRMNGDSTIYRQNYGAGMHYSDVTPDEQAAISGYRDELASRPGFSRERNIGDYNEAEKYNLTRKNANFLEDVAHDSRQTLNYVTERSIHTGLQDVYGSDSVHYGNPTFEQPKQLNGTKDIFATKDVAKAWNKLNPQQRERTIFGKAYDSINSLVTQGIVWNFIFHSGNQLWQAGEAVGKLKGPIGLTEFGKNISTMRAEDTRNAALGIYEHGGDIPDYGKNNSGMIARLTHGVSNVNRQAMAAVEFRVRTAAYKTLTDEGMDGRTAVKTLEQFMGDSHSFDIASRRFTIFLHYFKTLTSTQLRQIIHPIENAGTLANKATMLAALYAANYAWQQFTGNKHAYIRAPGGAGLIKEEVTAGQNVYHHHYRQALSIFTNRINPIPKEAVQQLFNQDLYSGQDLSSSGGRGTHAENTLVSPAQLGSKVTSGRKSLPEFVANELQLNTPHAKGAPAAPSGRLNVLNTPGSKPVAGEDKTGVDQQKDYFDSVEQAKRTLPAGRQKVYDAITAGETDANGQPVGMDDKQAQAHYAALYSNPDVLDAVVRQKQAYAKATNTPLDPLYSPNLTDAQRREYLHMQSLPYKGDDYIQQEGANKDWFQQLTKDRVAYFATQDFSGAPASSRVIPPTFDDATQNDLNTASGLTGTDKVKFIDAHPNVQQAYDAIAKYTNDRRVAEGNAPFKLFPHADPETQAIINTYMTLPTGDGKHGGNASRAAWIKANPTAYAKMQTYFTSEAEWELANSAGQDKFAGATPSQQELKSAYNLGKYDIAPPATPGGNYTLDPAAAYAATQASGSGLSNAYNNLKASNQRREAKNAVKYAGRSKKIIVKSFSQDRRKLSRYHSRSPVRVAQARPGKLRIKSTAVA